MTAALTLNDLTFKYNDSPIIEHLSWELECGEFALLLGPTGCGKSTLLKIAAQLLPKFGGQMTGTVTPHLTSGLMFQDPALQFTMSTPKDELLFTMENLQVSRETAAKRMQFAADFAEITPLLDQQISVMSGGEQQRVALAVLVAMDVDLLLLDEPFASVDPVNRAKLINKLAWLHQAGKTILLTDHQLDGYEQVISSAYQFKQQQLMKITDLSSLFQPVSRETATFALPTEQNAAFSFQQTRLSSNRLLLDQANLSIPQGKITLLTGANGVGKTSLFKALTKMMPYQGSLRYDGQEIKQLKAKQYLLQVAQIFQHANDQFLQVFVKDELALCQQNNPNLTEQVIKTYLAKLGLGEVINQSVYTLSGGQQKKLQLLLMLLSNHDVLLIDEPLAGLDAESRSQVINLIGAAKGKTMIIISHETKDLANICDYHLVFENRQLTYREN